MTTQQIADRLVALCRTGEYIKAQEELYHPEAISIEPDGAPVKEARGLQALKDKEKQFSEMIEEMHGSSVSDPLVADDHFAVRMSLDVTFKGAERSKSTEIAVYQVAEGKIIKEEFFFNP